VTALTLKQRRVCTHPELRPFEWNQPKPPPTEYYGCEHTAICPTCGYGFGCIPDPCNDVSQLVKLRGQSGL
jgi:hypothetical protein